MDLPHRRRLWAPLAACLALAATGTADATTFTVTSTGDQAAAAPTTDGVCASTAGACTLRAAIQEANATTAGAPHTIAFAIPTAGVATIVPATALPALTRAGTVLDATTQTTTIGNTNTAVLGTGGTVGTGGIPLTAVNGPEVLIRDNAALTIGLAIQASNVQVRGIAIHGFGTTSTATGDIVITTAAVGVQIRDCVIGSVPAALSAPAVAAQQSAGNGILVNAPDGGAIDHNIVAFEGQTGVLLTGGAATWQVTGNELRGNGRVLVTADGLGLAAAGSIDNVVTGNLAVANGSSGFHLAVGPNRLVNNTATGNGVFNAATTPETPGFLVGGSGSLLDRNVARANYGAGFLVPSAAQNNRILRASTSANGTITNLGAATPTGQIGIDLLAAADNQIRGTAPFRTLNDPNDADAGGNALTNFPIIQTATVNGATLDVTGFARPGASVELYLVATDPSGFGEGVTYLATQVEGTGSDVDTGTGTYGPAAVNGVAQGTDTTERFRFTVPLSSLPVAPTQADSLTATATVGTATSEFAGNAPVTVIPAALRLAGVVDAPDPVHVGQPLTYTTTVDNQGAGTTTNVVLTQTVPAGATVGSITPGQGTCALAGLTITCQLGTLPSGAGTTVVVGLTPSSPGTLTTVANVTGTNDPVASDNAGQADTTVVADADLSVTLLDAPDPATTGQEVTLTATVTNLGPDPAFASTATVTLPAGLTLVAASPSQGTCAGTVCTLGTIAGGSSAVVTVRTTAGPTGVHTADIAVTTASTDTVGANDTATTDTTVTAPADLRVGATVTPTALAPGERADVVFSVSNIGPSDATGVLLTHVLPTGARLISATASGGSCTLAGVTVACAFGSVAVGQTATATVAVTLQVPGETVFAATAVADQGDPTQPNTASAVATVTTPVAPPVAPPPPPAEADLDARLDTSRPALTPAGELTTFTLLAANRGAGNAADVRAELVLSAGQVMTLTVQGATCAVVAAAPPRVSCTAAALAPTGLVTVAVSVRATRRERITATATLATSSRDADPANDRASSDTIAPLGRLTIRLTHARSARTGQVLPLILVVGNPTRNVASDVRVTFGGPARGTARPVDVRRTQARLLAPAATPLSFSLGDIPPGGRRVLNLEIHTGPRVALRRLAAAVVAAGGPSGSQTGSTIRVLATLPARVPAVTG